MTGTPIKPRILLVDDDTMLLHLLRRLHDKRYDITTAMGGEEGLRALEENAAFEVIVSDREMPGMAGPEFLRRAAQLAPDAERLMLTGNVDVKVGFELLNGGLVARVLSKPCSAGTFSDTVDAAIERGRRRRADNEAFEGTLGGVLELLTGALALHAPAVYGRSVRVRGDVRFVAQALGYEHCWRVEAAALLTMLGWATVPRELSQGAACTDKARELLERLPAETATLLALVPRLDGVAQLVALQRLRYDQRGRQSCGTSIVNSALVLAACLVFDELITTGATALEAVSHMRRDPGAYAPEVLEVLASLPMHAAGTHATELEIDALVAGMVLDEDVESDTGEVVAGRGMCIDEVVLRRLRNQAHIGGVRGPIRVRTLTNATP